MVSVRCSLFDCQQHTDQYQLYSLMVSFNVCVRFLYIIGITATYFTWNVLIILYRKKYANLRRRKVG